MAAAESRGIVSSITSKLKDDDRALQRFERSASGHDSSEESKEISERAIDLTTKLVGYISEEVHCRLDRIYLKTLQSGTNATNVEIEDEADLITSLENELDSLYPEIGILTEMCAHQQFKSPILRELRNRHGQLQSASEEKLDYVRHTLPSYTVPFLLFKSYF